MKKALNMEKVIAEYNDMMFSLCLEFCTIGTDYSQDTEDWNLRDMVSESQYQLDCYYDDDKASSESRYSDDLYERNQWKNDTKRLKAFIRKYEKHIDELECTVGHCSKFDN